MCGIAGFYGFEDDKLLNDFSKRLAHRGPDGKGIYKDDTVSLLNRRLAIIDVAGGDQPIFNEDGSKLIIFVGEIYNYLELREPLIKSGHVFKTKSDTEVVLHGFEQEGTAFFDKLNGMFTIAIYDKTSKRLTLARDHFGIKPLYYSIGENGLIFSSEIKPIFYSGYVEQSPNDKVIYRYLKYRIHDDQKETFFKDIYRLMPGEVLEFAKGKTKTFYYSHLKDELVGLSQDRKFDRMSEKRAVATMKKSLHKAIQYRLISEVPVGTCLSGGLDSSTVVSVVNRMLVEKEKGAKAIGKVQNTFSAVFPGGINDEEKYIDEVTKFKSLKVYKVKPKAKEFIEDISYFIRVQEEPTISTGPYAQYKVMEKAHGKVTVLLDGQGADEMMAGYMPYYMVYWRQLLKDKKYGKLLTELLNSPDVLRKYFRDRLQRPVKMDSLLSKKFSGQFESVGYHPINDNLKLRLLEDIFSDSLQSLLRYEDRNAMRFSIEGRVPFLDFELVRFIFSLPEEAVIENGWNKNILRLATRDLLPASVNKRRNKIGFTTPEYQWFFEIKKIVFEIFLSESFANRKYFDRPEVLRAFQDFLDKKNFDTMVFWRIMNVELWMREFFDQKVQKDHKDHKVSEVKESKIIVDGKTYKRQLIKTDFFKKGDDYIKKISDESLQCFKTLKSGDSWFIVVSEKVVATSQGRSHFIWDIHPGFFAKILSKYVTKTSAGIGLGSPWTMQLAIDEVGLPKIILAATASFLGKTIGMKGLFYKIAGEVVRSIDGPTEYSLYPANVSAKLGPKEPQQVAKRIKSEILNLKSQTNSKFRIQNSEFLGAVIIDANDIGRNVLGNSTGLENSLVERIMADNPMGQGREQTPITIVSYN